MLAAAAAAAAAASTVSAAGTQKKRNYSRSNSSSTSQNHLSVHHWGSPPRRRVLPQLSRYEAEKRRDWDNFVHFPNNLEPPMHPRRCNGDHAVEYFTYLDRFGRTKVHISTCRYFGHVHQSEECECPLKMAYGTLDSTVRQLRMAFEENIGSRVTNPFTAPAVGEYMRKVRDSQASARWIS